MRMAFFYYFFRFIRDADGIQMFFLLVHHLNILTFMKDRDFASVQNSTREINHLKSNPHEGMIQAKVSYESLARCPVRDFLGDESRRPRGRPGPDPAAARAAAR